MVEFALVLPIMSLLLGACLDLARVYEQQINLEAATRDAAEFSATTSLNQAGAATEARRVVCLQFGQPAGCSSPSVTVVSYARNTSASGATTTYPLVTVQVRSSAPFRPLLPYPFVGETGIQLTAASTYAVLQGR